MFDSKIIKIFIALLITTFIGSPSVLAQGKANSATKRVIDFWDKDRRANATPRDLLIDSRGLGYLRKKDGSLQPYGHRIAAKQLRASGVNPFGKPTSPGGGGDDSEAPLISNMSPSEGATIGSSQIFSAVVTDAGSGVKSVTFIVTYPDGVNTQSFSANHTANDTWEISLQGFSNGDWQWHVEAKDSAKKGGNLAVSDSVSFTVDTSSSGGNNGGGGNDGYIVTNDSWANGGVVQNAAGRVYFEMPNRRNRSSWSGYVCSGTVATDDTTGRSVIITAAHCVYDDANKAFARNVLFIPNQDGTSGSGTDLNCNNDPIGCWVPSFGVVDDEWTNRRFPDNIPWDYAFYVVNDNGSHQGAAASSDALDAAAGSLPVSFATPQTNDGDPSATSADFTHALGYSYSDDPNFMYCAEDMTTIEAANWWLANCGMSGGASGGPWMQPMDTTTGTGPIISVNSWGYTDRPGMAGPQLDVSSASCVFSEAKGVDFLSIPAGDGNEGLAVLCP